MGAVAHLSDLDSLIIVMIEMIDQFIYLLPTERSCPMERV
jgi:hypothetical protein